MYYFTIDHKIENFEKWKPVFDSDESRRQSKNIQTIQIMKDIEDENHLVVLLSAPSVEVIKERLGDQSLQQKWKEAGMLGKPVITIYKV